MTGILSIGSIRKHWILLSVLVLAAVLRLGQIDRATEFLGDQGSAAVVILESWKARQLPLYGPMVSLGIRPGPLYYYLIAPWLIATGFNPVAVSVFFAIAGVLAVWMMYIIGRRLFDKDIGLIIAALYAVSPAIVHSSRMMWNPTAIPVFVLLMLYFTLKLRDLQQYRYAALTGAMAGCLLQLHYTTLIISLCVFGVQIFIWKERKKTTRIRRVLSGVVLWSLGFLLSLFPFLYAEYTNNFPNIRELLLMALGEGSPVSDALRSEPAVAYGYSLEMFRNIVPLSRNVLLWGIQILLLGVAVLFGKRPGRMLAVMYIVGILVMSRYSGPMFNHYFYFIVPLPFLLVGFLFVLIKRHVGVTAALAAGIVWCVWVGFGTIAPRQYPGDVQRIRDAVQRMIQAANGMPFSFTLTRSRSFSDFHYRFYFQLNAINPAPVLDRSYPILFLVCEQLPCPAHEELERPRELDTMCSDHHCSGQYPKIFFDDWEYANTINGATYTIYQYQRRTTVPAGR